jgi:hypothetical protein
LAECQNFPLRLVFSRATTEGLERKTVHSIRKLVFLWILDWKKACVFGMCISLQCNENVPLLLNSVWMGEARDTCCEICFVGVWEQSSCASLTLVRIQQTVSELYIFGGLSCVEWFRQTWTPGFVENSRWAVYFRTLFFLVISNHNLCGWKRTRFFLVL